MSWKPTEKTFSRIREAIKCVRLIAVGSMRANVGEKMR